MHLYFSVLNVAEFCWEFCLNNYIMNYNTSSILITEQHISFCSSSSTSRNLLRFLLDKSDQVFLLYLTAITDVVTAQNITFKIACVFNVLHEGLTSAEGQEKLNSTQQAHIYHHGPGYCHSLESKHQLELRNWLIYTHITVIILQYCTAWALIMSRIINYNLTYLKTSQLKIT